MVFTMNVRLLMGNNVFQILTVHVEREIDSWFNDAKHKRRTYILALENVVVDVIAGHCVKGLIREIQVCGISLAEADIFYSFSLCIILAEGLVEGCVLLAPTVFAGPSGIRSFAAGTMARAPAVPPINEATIPFGIQFL